MKLRDKNPVVKNMLAELAAKGLEEPLWTAVAKGINRPRRKRHEVNLHDIERHAQAKETIVVPGAVLASGYIKKPVTVAALKFSGEAQKAIEKAGGRCISIEELMASKPKNVRILG